MNENLFSLQLFLQQEESFVFFWYRCSEKKIRKVSTMEDWTTEWREKKFLVWCSGESTCQNMRKIMALEFIQFQTFSQFFHNFNLQLAAPTIFHSKKMLFPFKNSLNAQNLNFSFSTQQIISVFQLFVKKISTKSVYANVNGKLKQKRDENKLQVKKSLFANIFVNWIFLFCWVFLSSLESAFDFFLRQETDMLFVIFSIHLYGWKTFFKYSSQYITHARVSYLTKTHSSFIKKK